MERPLDLRAAERDLLLRQAGDRRRLHELAAAVRDHATVVRGQIGGPHPRPVAVPAAAPGGRPLAPADAVAALLEAVRAHQVLTKNRAVPRRPADHALYGEVGLA